MYKLGFNIPVPTPASYKKEYPFLKEADSLALANVQLNLNKAFKSFFNGISGFPKFKAKYDSVQSYTTNNQHGTIEIIGNRCIKLPKIGIVDAVIHKRMQPYHELRSVTVSRGKDGRYYAAVVFRYLVKSKPVLPDIPKALGLDYKSDGLYMDSEGNFGGMPKFYQRSHKMLAKVQHQLSKKKGARKGEEKSKRYLKQLKKVNRIYAKIADQRKDFLHKESRKIANSCDIVCVESLNMKTIANKGFGNGKATMNNAYGIFLSMLEYKLKKKGGMLVRIDKWFPSS